MIVMGLLAVMLASCGGSGAGPSEETNPVSNQGTYRTNRGITPVEPGRKIEAVTGQTIYVPIYSHVYTSNDARPFNLAVTLGVRNTDSSAPIILNSVRYYNSDGRLVRDYQERPVRLAPLAAAEYFIRERDTSGGLGASFLVEWVAEQDVSVPVVEAVMIGTASTQGISFITEGRVIKSRKP